MGHNTSPRVNKMPKGNNQVPNAHFHKDWDHRVRCWFNQPGRKLRRRTTRATKAAKINPRPVAGLLRPSVRCPTRKYNMKERLGRGFTMEELKEAGISRKQALTIGVSVDWRRRNKSADSLQTNVQRLKQYQSNLVLFPRRRGQPKTGDSDAAQLATAKQQTGSVVVPANKTIKKSIKAVKISKKDQEGSVYTKLREARAFARYAGARKKRAEQAEAKKKGI